MGQIGLKKLGKEFESMLPNKKAVENDQLLQD